MTDEKFGEVVRDIISAYIQDMKSDYVREFLTELMGLDLSAVELDALVDELLETIKDAGIETHEVLEGTCA